MLEFLNIKSEGRLHSGIDDATNIAKCALQLLKDGFGYLFMKRYVYHRAKIEE